MRPHPLSLILLGGAVLLAAASRDGMSLYLCCSCLMLAALVAAKSDLRLLVTRSRWLLLTMLVMFGWLTPGTPLPGIPGASQEGLQLAADNLARLFVALATLALLLKALDPSGLVAGLRALLAPLVLLGFSRDRIAVRLALTLQEVEASQNGRGNDSVRTARSLALPSFMLGTVDVLLGGLSSTLVLAALLT